MRDSGGVTDDAGLVRVAELLANRNRIDAEIAAVTGRPMASGHLGEWLASRVFGIDLAASTSQVAYDGVFAEGPLRGRTVNVKWYLRREGLLDMTASDVLDHYLVMTGPAGAAGSSREGTRPWVVSNVYLFDARELRDDLAARGRRAGTASSVRREAWSAVEVYPRPSPLLPLSARQRDALALFAPGE